MPKNKILLIVIVVLIFGSFFSNIYLFQEVSKIEKSKLSIEDINEKQIIRLSNIANDIVSDAIERESISLIDYNSLTYIFHTMDTNVLTLNKSLPSNSRENEEYIRVFTILGNHFSAKLGRSRANTDMFLRINNEEYENLKFLSELLSNIENNSDNTKLILTLKKIFKENYLTIEERF